MTRSALNYDRDYASASSALYCPEKTLAQQSQKEEADINTIVRRFGITGQLPQGVRVPSYGDFDGVSDYREALEAVESAKDSFMRMPAAVRARFDNDPGAFVDFCSDPGNLEELRRLGLAVPAKNEKEGEPATPPAGS